MSDLLVEPGLETGGTFTWNVDLFPFFEASNFETPTLDHFCSQ